MLLTDSQYKERLTRLNELKVPLDTDISSVSVPAMLRKLAEIQNQRERSSSAIIEAFNNCAESKAILEDAKIELDMQMDNILSTDDNVKAQKTSEMRSSLASTKCADLMLKKHHALLETIRAESYFNSVKIVCETLKTTYDSLSQQIDLLKFGLEMGLLPIDNFSQNNKIK